MDSWPVPKARHSSDSASGASGQVASSAASGQVDVDLENMQTDHSFNVVSDVEIVAPATDAELEEAQTEEPEGAGETTAAEFEMVDQTPSQWPPESPPLTPRVEWSPEDFERLNTVISDLSALNQQLLVFTPADPEQGEEGAADDAADSALGEVDDAQMAAAASSLESMHHCFYCFWRFLAFGFLAQCF